MRGELHPEATAEFRAAAEYYEKQHRGLDSRFINAVMHCRREPGYWRDRV